jgi:dTDP-4-amino-4,6-dideoxygalactose transaminase
MATLPASCQFRHEVTNVGVRPETVEYVERALLDPTGSQKAYWCGRGATALYWAYRAARRLGKAVNLGEIVVPAISCASPINTAVLAGLTPRFADVDPASGMPTMANIRARCTSNTCAILFIHLYGQTADMTELAAWCRERGILLIEDAAHALGAQLPRGSPVGSTGDCCIYSFNRTKILECGGGLLTTRSDHCTEMADRIVREEPLPEAADPERLKYLAQSYRNLHFAMAALFRLKADVPLSRSFLAVREAYDALYLRSIRDPSAVARAWSSLPRTLEHRRTMAAKYEDVLDDGPWTRLDGWRDSGVCWRYTLLLERDAALPSELVRRDGFHVSNLYWPMNQFFGKEDPCPNANAFARRVMNLWVDETVNIDRVSRCAESIIQHATALGPQLD